MSLRNVYIKVAKHVESTWLHKTHVTEPYLLLHMHSLLTSSTTQPVRSARPVSTSGQHSVSPLLAHLSGRLNSGFARNDSAHRREP